MNVIKIKFKDRSRPVFIPITEENVERLMGLVERPNFSATFIELDSAIGQRVWLNLNLVKTINYLYESIDVSIFSDLKDSEFYEMDTDRYDDSIWRVTLYIRGNEAEDGIDELSGHDWVAIYTSLDMPNEFFTIEDDDGEYLSVRVDEVELVIGTEISRYSNKQLDHIDRIIES